MITYYLFLDKEFCIYNVFETLRDTGLLEPGVTYTQIKETSVIPSCIIIESIYKGGYLKEVLTELLDDIGYDKSFEIVQPV
jgi:hypothetical protein